MCVGAVTTHRVIDYSTFLTGHTYVTDGRQPDESDKAMTKAKSGEKDGESPSQQIDARIAELDAHLKRSTPRLARYANRLLSSRRPPELVDDDKD